jgi:hypothetical protein
MPSVTLRLSENHYRLFRKLAEEENRSLPNFIETATLRHIREGGDAEPAEPDEASRDAELRRSIGRGHIDARLSKGRLAE